MKSPIEIQMDNEFPNNHLFNSYGHGMDVEDIPESWFVKKGLSTGYGIQEEFVAEAIEDRNLKVMATTAAKSTAKNGLTNAEQISKDVMKSDRIVIPVEQNAKENPEIHKYLADRGYTVHGEYKAGLAVHQSNPNRPLRIGRILSATGAPESLQKAWENDAVRKGVTKQPETQIVISRHPYDVAAMSSGQHWESCQTLAQKNVLSMSTDPEKNGKPQENGLYSQMVPGIIASGAHVAYHVKNPDDIKEHYKPIGRHTLNVFVSNTGHRILRPSQHYGYPWENFTNTLNDWAEKNFPAKDAVYIRHRDSYPEGDSAIYNFSPEHDEYWKHNPNAESVRNHSSPEVLNQYIDFMRNPPTRHLVSASNLALNPHLTTDMQDKMYRSVKNTGYALDMENAAKVAPERHVDTLLDIYHKNKLSHTGVIHLAQNQNSNADQMHTMIDAYGAGNTNIPGVRKLSKSFPDKSIKILTAIAAHRNADDSHLAKMLELNDFSPENNSDPVKSAKNMADYSNMLENIATKYNSEDIGRKLVSIIPKSGGSEAAKATAPIIRDIAAKHPHLIGRDFDDEQIVQAINKAHFSNADSHKNLVNIAIARNSEKTLRAVAANTKDKELLNKLSKHENPMVSRQAQINMMHSAGNT